MGSFSRNPLKGCLRIAGSLLAVLVLRGSADAATLTWTGGGGDNNIGTAANWSPAQIPVAGDVLIFAGGTRLTPQLVANLTVASLTFNATAQAFALGGAGAYTVNGGGITNNSTSTQTIGNAIVLGADQAWNAASGNLVINGTVNLGVRTLTNSGGNTTTITGAVSGTGGIRQNGAGTLSLSGNNTYGGDTIVTNGTLVIGSNTALGTGTLSMDGGTLASNADARTLANAIVVNAVAGNTITGSNSMTLTGAATSGGAGSTLIVDFTDTTKGLTVNPTTANSFAPGAVDLEGGSLILGASNRIADGTSLTMDGGTLNTQGFSDTLGAMILAANSSINFGTSNTVRLQFSSASWTGGTLTLLNWTGTIGASNNADQILVQGAVSQDFLDRVNFQGMGVGVGAVAFDRGGGLYEIVPVPEPSTIGGALAALGLLGFRERRRIARLARCWRS